MNYVDANPDYAITFKFYKAVATVATTSVTLVPICIQLWTVYQQRKKERKKSSDLQSPGGEVIVIDINEEPQSGDITAQKLKSGSVSQVEDSVGGLPHANLSQKENPSIQNAEVVEIAASKSSANMTSQYPPKSFTLPHTVEENAIGRGDPNPLVS